ncbi:MAG TPA: Hpt domain-containing protein [Parvularculaceae bacterium]|nr:Hpt domain-containing protein [Parvularculaceae bacterium]
MSGAFDLAHLERYVCGDDALRNEILTIFEEQAAQWIGRFAPEAEDDDWRDAAHALKGAARGIGAWAIGDLCEAAEKLVAGTPEKVAKRKVVLAELRRHIDAAVEETKRLRASAA